MFTYLPLINSSVTLDLSFLLLSISVSCCWFIRLNNEFVFPNKEPPVINILYGWS